MKLALYKKIKLSIMVAMMVGVGMAIRYGLEFVVFLVMGGGMVFMSFLKSWVEDDVVDERVEDVAGRAARMAYMVLMPVLGLTALALYGAGGRGEFYYVRGLGIVMSYVTSLGLVIYVLAYGYFERKFGA